MEDKYLKTRTWIEIDMDAIMYNFNAAKQRVSKGTGIMAVIKADGYGHGALSIARMLDDKAACFGVATSCEALLLREAGIKTDILILGGTDPLLYDELIKNGVMPVIFDYNNALIFSETAKKLGVTARCAAAVDTGMSRIGFLPTEEGAEELKKSASLPNIIFAQIFSHFARADEYDKTSAYLQIKRFDSFCAMLEEKGIHIPVRSLCNSAGIMELESCYYEMVREGITLYGLYPSDEVDKSRLDIRPAMSVRTKVTNLKTVGAGEGVSYGHIYVTDRDTRIATLAIGYADGLPRLMSNKGFVLLHGRRAPIIGRVCMDQTMVDVTNIPEVCEGDTATVIGADGDEYISADEVAGIAQTVSYEIICGFARSRVPRLEVRKLSCKESPAKNFI